MNERSCSGYPAQVRARTDGGMCGYCVTMIDHAVSDSFKTAVSAP